MGVWADIKNFFRAEETGTRVTNLVKTPPPAGRTSLDNTDSIYQIGWTMLAPADYNDNWRLKYLDVTHLDSYSPKDLLDMLIDISPEISFAIWQFQRLCNPGYEYKAYRLGSEDAENMRAKKHLDDFFALLKERYKSVDVVLGRLFMGAYLRGAFAAELVLDANGRKAIDLATPDPYSIRFRKRKDSVLGEWWEPGQLQKGNFVSLNIPTFCYLPIDPAPASPYGRSLASPALFTAVFSLSLLYDVKRVVMQQGYRRMDITLNTEQAMDSFSYDQQGYDTLGDYMRAAIDAVKETYRLLEPEDAFIHSDLFELNSPTGTIDTDSIAAIDKIIERLEKKLARALKTNGVVLDTSDNRNEADSNRKWEIHAQGVKSLQHYCENMLETLLTLSLQAAGIQARVEFRFAELRAAEMLRDAQTLAMKIQNATAAYQAGFVSQDEASNMAVNHDADVPEPRDAAPEESELVEDNSESEEEIAQEQEEVNRSMYTYGYRGYNTGNGIAFTNGK